MNKTTPRKTEPQLIRRIRAEKIAELNTELCKNKSDLSRALSLASAAGEFWGADYVIACLHDAIVRVDLARALINPRLSADSLALPQHG